MKFITNVIKVWKSEKGNAAIRLGIGIVFMIILVAYARNLNSRPTTAIPKSYMESYYTKSSYVAKVKLNDSEYTLTHGSSIEFSNDEELCKLRDELICLRETNFDVYFWNITPSLIYSLVKEKEPLYTTNYNDSTRDKAYNIPLNEFVNYFKGKKIDNIETEDNILIIITDDNKDVLKVKLDLTNYYKLVADSNDNYIVEIEY